MRPTTYKSIVRAGWYAGFCLAISSATMVYAQDPQSQQTPNIRITFGATPQSTVINAQANYAESYGEYLKSAAIAREINAKAVEQEIKNSVEYARAYYDKKKIYEDWQKEHGWKRYSENLDNQLKALEKRINEHFQFTLKGDLTNELNYLLQQLFYVQYMSPGDLKPLDYPLEGLDQIYLTDGKLVFKAGEGEMLKTPWPYALRGEEFANARKEFEDSRDAVVQEIQAKGQAGKESSERMMKAVNQLLVTLETVYPPERRKDFDVYQSEYYPAISYLNSLIVQTTRAKTTTDPSLFSGSMTFKGKTLLDLINFMNQKGFTFARPQSGGERIYKPLFMNMRQLYINLTLGIDKKAGGDLPFKK